MQVQLIILWVCYQKGKLNVVAQAAGAAFAAIGAVEGGAQLLFSAIDERFNLATELRQRGVFSAFEDVNTNVQSFAEEVMNNTFSLEQSAEMVRNFSQSVWACMAYIMQCVLQRHCVMKVNILKDTVQTLIS